MKRLAIALLAAALVAGCIPPPPPLADANQTIERVVEVQPDVFVPLVKGANGEEIKAASALLLLDGGDAAVIACEADELHIVSTTLTSVSVDCIAYTPTPEPTATATATATNTPLPTNTPEPTNTPLPTATNTPLPSAHIEPFADGPPCVEHDDIAYHGIWDYALGCHYDHTHYLDPLAPEIVAIFGDYTEWTGQEVSYPWQTFAGAMPGFAQPPADAAWENDHKHAGYKFDFYDFPVSEYGCTAANPTAKAVPNAWLIQRHSLGHKGGFMTRVHSVWAMVRFCIPGTNEVAWLYTGGWQDFGQRVSPYQGNIYPIPTNPLPSYPSPRAPYIAHGCSGHPDCRDFANIAWISFAQMIDGHRLFGFGFRSDDSQQTIDASAGFDTADPTFVYICNDGAGNFVAEGCEYNHSTAHAYQLTGAMPAEYDLLDGLDDERVNYEGYTDRWGNVVQGCTEAALDCVPVKIVNMPVGPYHANVIQYGIPVRGSLPEFDVYFGDEPSGWLSAEN